MQMLPPHLPLSIRSRNIHLHSCFYNCYFPNRHTPCPCCWQTSLVGIFINIRANIGQTPISPKPALKFILLRQLHLFSYSCALPKDQQYILVSASCIFSCCEDQRVYEWKTLIKQVGLTSFSSQNGPSPSLLLDLLHTQSSARVRVLGWLQTQRLVFDKFGYIKRDRTKWDNETAASARMENRGADHAEGHRRDQGTVGFRAATATLKRGHMALMGCQLLSGAFSIQQTWKLASHIILVPYQVLTTACYCLTLLFILWDK